MNDRRQLRKMCNCGREELPYRRRQCDQCRAESARKRARSTNERAADRRKQGILPPSWRKEYVPKYEQIKVATPWVPKPKPVLSDKERERLNNEMRRQAEDYDRRHMERFGLLARKGKPLASTAKKLSPAEIAEIAHLYMPPCRDQATVIVPYFGEGRE